MCFLRRGEYLSIVTAELDTERVNIRVSTLLDYYIGVSSFLYRHCAKYVKSRSWFVILHNSFKLSTHSSLYFVISSTICFLFWWCHFHPHIEPTQDHNMLMFSFSIFSQCVVSKWENLNITFIIALINFSSFH